MTPAEPIELLTPIPEEDFVMEVYTNNVDKCCAVGHLVRLTSEDPTDYSTRNCVPFGEGEHRIGVNTLRKRVFSEIEDTIGSVNNGETSTYQQETPKQRVLAMLTTLKSNL